MQRIFVLILLAFPLFALSDAFSFGDLVRSILPLRNGPFRSPVHPLLPSFQAKGTHEMRRRRDANSQTLTAGAQEGAQEKRQDQGQIIIGGGPENSGCIDTMSCPCSTWDVCCAYGEKCCGANATSPDQALLANYTSNFIMTAGSGASLTCVTLAMDMPVFGSSRSCAPVDGACCADGHACDVNFACCADSCMPLDAACCTSGTVIGYCDVNFYCAVEPAENGSAYCVDSPPSTAYGANGELLSPNGTTSGGVVVVACLAALALCVLNAILM